VGIWSIWDIERSPLKLPSPPGVINEQGGQSIADALSTLVKFGIESAGYMIGF
jgi:hypothetical protein